MTTRTRQDSTPGILPCNVKAAVFFNGECDLPGDFFRLNHLYDDFDFFCADGGANIALKYGIIPQAVVGDMDSITAANRRKLEPLTRFIEFPEDKEKSDGELLLEMLEGQGYDEIHIFAATGGRIDQTLFNTQLLQRFPQSRIITANEEIYFLSQTSLIEGKEGCQASLIPITPRVNSLTTEGFKFNLNLCDITYGSTLTLSNVVTEEIARITYQEGAMLIVLARPHSLTRMRPPSGLKLIKGKKGR